MKMLKNSLVALLAIVLTCPPVYADEQSTLARTGQVSAESYQREVDGVTFSLEEAANNIAAINEWDQMAAANGINESVANELLERFSAAVDLLAVIYADQTLAKEQKNQLFLGIYKAIGNLLLQVSYNEGEDAADYDALVKRLEQKPNSFTDGMREVFINDIGAFFTSRKAAQGSRVWKPSDRINREDLFSAMLDHMQEFAKETTPLLPVEADDKGYRNFITTFARQTDRDVELNRMSRADMLINIRETRLAGQRVAVAIYLGMAFMAFVGPTIDWVGAAERIATGFASDGSASLSASSYAAMWLTFAALKWKSISYKTLTKLRDLKSLFLDPNANVEIEKSILGQHQSLFRRAIHKVGDACTRLFSKNKLSTEAEQ